VQPEFVESLTVAVQEVSLVHSTGAQSGGGEILQVCACARLVLRLPPHPSPSRLCLQATRFVEQSRSVAAQVCDFAE
jgi:hypothetical protein